MKILMVCLGNICRSPIAEGIMKKRIADMGLDWTVDSAGTSSFHNGGPPHRDSQRICKVHGIDISDQRSMLFTARAFDQYDLIIAMDDSNYQDIIRQTQSSEDRDKVKRLLDYSYPGQRRGVPDPYYEGGFDYVYDLIDQSCSRLIQTHYK